MNDSWFHDSRCQCLFTRTTDTQRELFFKNPKLLGLGRQIGLKFLRKLSYFWPNYQHYFGTVSPLSMEKCIFGSFSYKKLWFSGLKHITPKYDIGRKKFGKEPSHFRLWCLFKKIRFLFHRIIHSVDRTSKKNSVVIFSKVHVF